MSTSPASDPSPQNEPASAQSFPAPIIPVVQELQNPGRTGIPVEITQTIARVKPDVAMDYVDQWVKLEYQDRDKERSHQFQLAQAKLALEERKEANQAADRSADRSLIQGSIRWGLGIFLAVFLSALGFSIAVKDAEGKIPQTVLSFAAGIVGGTGLTAGLKRHASNQDDAKQKS